MTLDPSQQDKPAPSEDFASDSKADADSEKSYNRWSGDAATEDFAHFMNRSSFYNDDLDMDQQSQEYWDSL